MRSVKRFVLTLLSTLLLVACGGGGGGGGGNSLSDALNAQPTTRYSGNSSQATVDNASAAPVGTKALSAQEDAAAAGGTMRTGGTSNAIEIAKNLILKKQSVTKDSLNTRAGTACGGTATDLGSTANGNTFAGAVQFSSYCEMTGMETITMNGRVVYSGTTANNSSGVTYVSSLTMRFIDVTTTQQPSNDNFTLAGSYTFTLTDTSTVLSTSISMIVVDSTGATLWLDNYTVTPVGGQYTIQGRLYHPTYGYVDITTSSPLTISGKWPSAGAIEITGSGGTRACLTAVSSLQYRVDLDNDHNGVCETLVGTYNWPTN